MIGVVPVPDPGLGNTSYVVDLGDGSALVVDPERDPRPYLQVADRLGLTIGYVAETHLHADFVSGARELVAMGAELVAPTDSLLAHPHRPVGDGDELTIGDLTLRVLATPGHTPEHVAYLLLDGAVAQVAFTGGTLMVGGVARPDLISSELTTPLARSAYHSVGRLLDSLPDTTTVLPTHGGGSFCSSITPGAGPATTVGEQRRSHPVCLAPDIDVFVEHLLSGLGTYPSYFRRLRAVNRQGPEVYGVDLPEFVEVAPKDADPWTVVDARPIERFAAGHIPGSISNELRGGFGTWLGWLFEPDTPIAFVVDPDQDERELMRQALNVGQRPPFGRLTLDAWTAAEGTLDFIDLIPATAIASDATIIDIRQHSEWAQEHVEGAVHVELADLLGDVPTFDGSAVIHCSHGQRAMTAASLLHRHDHARVAVTTDGPTDISKAVARR